MSIVPGRDVPAVPQAWVDAVNKAVNDANHEDLCSSFHALAECDSYKPGQWDIGVDLTIAVGVLEPLIRERVAQPATEHVFELTFDGADPVVVRGVRTFEYTTWDPEKGGCRRRGGDPTRMVVNSRTLQKIRLLAPDEIPPYAVPGTYWRGGVTYHLNDGFVDRFGDRWEFDHWRGGEPMLRATVVDGIPIGTGAKRTVGDIVARFGPLAPVESPDVSR